jgi:hypothetical protein
VDRVRPFLFGILPFFGITSPLTVQASKEYAGQ